MPEPSRLRRLSLLLLVLLLAACAIRPAPATPTPTLPAPSAEPSPAPAATSSPHNTLTVPHWLSFDYPGDWHRIAGRAPGFAGVASRDVGILPENNLQPGTALFYAFQSNTTSGDPLAALQDDRLTRLSTDITILDPPAALTVAGVPAAALRYRFELADGSPGIVRLILLRDAGGRYAELWAISRESELEQFAPVLRQIEATVTLHDMLPAPAIPAPSEPPTAYRPVPAPDALAAAGNAFSLSIPPDWRATEAEFGLLIRPSAVPDAAQIIAAPVPEAGDAATGDAAAVLETLAQQLLPQLIYDAVRVSPIAAEEYEFPGLSGPASLARAYYTGTDQNNPRFIILHTLVHDDQQLYALTLLQIPTTSPPALAPIAESILNTLTPSIPQRSSTLPPA